MTKEKKDTTAIDLSRRSVLKVTVGGLVAWATAPLLYHLPSAFADQTGTGNTKMLIVYYSRSGNTREIARQIHACVGGDSVEIQTVEPYPEDYNATTKQAKQELNSGYMPPLKTKIQNINSYDVIFVGSPNWWNTIATPVRSFLSEYDLSGKTIAPFITHGGSGLGRSATDIATLCPKATIRDGLAVWGKDAKSAENEVAAWLRRLKMKE